MPQKSEEWFIARAGLFSASKADCIAANGKGLQTYCRQLSRERLGILSLESFTNSDIERGDELEAPAIFTYELVTGLSVQIVGGVTNDKYPECWVSPDGLVGDDGGVEVKARNDEKHHALIEGDTKDIPVAQIQKSLMITGRKWWDFVSYNPNFREHPIFIKRLYPDYTFHMKLKAGLDRGSKLIPKMIDNYKNYKFEI